MTMKEIGSLALQVHGLNTHLSSRLTFQLPGDSTVRIWSGKTLNILYTIIPYLENGSGDIFSLAWSPILQHLYFGCQNTSLQWLDLRQSAAASGTSTPLGPR